MKFLKILLFCFFFFGLGNLKAQKIDNETLKTNLLYKFHILLKNKYLEKGETLIIRNDKLISLREKYDERINLLGEKNSELFLENASSLNNFKVIYCAVLEKTLPDINAVFFNRGNVLSDEKISDEEKQKYNALFLEISKQIPNETYIELSKITDEINRDKFALTVPYRFEIFQDLFDENQRKRIDIINFLLWNVE